MLVCKVLSVIFSIFILLILVFVGVGLIFGIVLIFFNMMLVGDISKSWIDFIIVLKVINSGLFLYLVIYVGINSVMVFGVIVGLGGVIGVVMLLIGVML